MKFRQRRAVVVVISLAVALSLLASSGNIDFGPRQPDNPPVPNSKSGEVTGSAMEALDSLPVKGRAPKTGYSRSQFGSGWTIINGCDMRNIILKRDLTQTELGGDGCTVISGVLNDPYTGKQIDFRRGPNTSNVVQIDHVVALSDAWQKGAVALTAGERANLANDPLELLAVDGAANQQKSDGDAATWLPSNKSFRCQYVARQIAVKHKYKLWVTSAEKQAIERILDTCPAQNLPQK